MKNIVFQECEKTLSNVDVLLLEETLQLKLPEDYKEFLLKHNGGYPVKDCFSAINQELGIGDISWFYAVYSDRDRNLVNNYKNQGDMIPNSFLPIARSSGGNEICLGVSPEIFGRVYFFVQSWDVDENNEPLPDCMYTVANSFADFINSLYFMDVDGYSNENEAFVVSRITNIHDTYSLPLSTEAKKYGAIVTDFFAAAPSEVTDYLIIKECTDDESLEDERILQYSVVSQGVRFCRRINADGSFEDYQEQLA